MGTERSAYVKGVSRRTILRAGAALALGGQNWNARAAERELQFGLTPVFLTSDLDLLGKLKAYLDRAVGRPVKLVTKRSYQEITSLLVSGQLDAAWICGYPFVAYRRQLELVAVPVWRGSPLYQSYLIGDHGRQGHGIDDLKGDVHAFSDPDSNSGFLVTRALLAERHVTPDQFFQKSFFTYGHRNVVRAVASGLANSGSVDGYVWEVMDEVERDLTRQTRVIARSEFLGFPPVATSRELADTPQIRTLRAALLAMPGDPAGREVLALLRLDGFVESGADIFDGIAARMNLVRSAG